MRRPPSSAALRSERPDTVTLRRVTAIAVAAAALALALTGGALGGAVAAPVKVTLTAPGHSPKVETRWYYSVRATRGGRPAAGRISEYVVDPLGGSTPVEYSTTKRKVVNRPFAGTFRDFIIWPAQARGIPLTLRIVVVAGGTRNVLRYPVTPTA
jgi:hypothetical protein